MKIYKIARADFLSRLNALRPQMCQAAQITYDAWDQNEDGEDVELGYGGLCQDVASAISDVLSSNGISCYTLSAEVGEQHVWVLAWEKDNPPYNGYHVDIPPGVYETGGGYTWRKIPDVVFSPRHIDLYKADDETVEYALKDG